MTGIALGMTILTYRRIVAISSRFHARAKAKCDEVRALCEGANAASNKITVKVEEFKNMNISVLQNALNNAQEHQLLVDAVRLALPHIILTHAELEL